MQKTTIAVLLGAVVLSGPVIQAALADVGDCPEVPAHHSDGGGPWDYRDPASRISVSYVEGNHFSKDTELLRRGNTGDTPGADITYLLNRVPNHPRALLAFMNYVEKTKMDRPQDARFGLECAFARARSYAPDDPAVWALHAMYLNKRGRLDDAIAEMAEASKLAPSNGNIHYNLGLLYFAKKDYENARSQAKQAYELGFPLPGLKEKLVKAGQWEK
jgi:tetratricopeptide (TPR) repeat protein